MERWNTGVVYFLVFFFLVCGRFGVSASLNQEGRALLRFRESIEKDPYESLSNWKEGGASSPCSWFGVECSDDGRVVALILKDLGLKAMLSPELGKLIDIRILDVCNNSFYGHVPREFANMQKLEVLELRQNNLSGAVPSDLGKIFSLKLLLLKGNRFSGDMPPKLQELNVLSEILADEELPSSRKCLTRTLGSPTIRQLLQTSRNVVRQRKLEGSALGKIAPNHQSTSLPPQDKPSHSPVTSGYEPKWSLESLPPPPPSVSETDEKKFRLPHWAIYLLAIGGAVCLVIAATAMYLLFFRTKEDNNTIMPWATGLSGQLRKAFVTGVPSLGRPELEMACEDFSNVIGTLSDCTLYKGTLSSGVEIAVVSTLVKSSKEWSDHSEDQFRKKISVLSRVNHKNFVNLLGYCTSDEPFTRMMVFEYAPCGSLFEHLHIKEAEHLDWPARLRIIMGVIYCLEYMDQLDPPVVARNLNSSSIYLTEDYAAKISDLGFWKDEKEARVQNSDQDSIVYKFGILLLEVISGRLPFSEDDGLLVLWASSYLDGKRPLSSMADPTLKSIPDKDITALCDVVRLCINPNPDARPTMAEIARQMRSITSLPPDQVTPKDNPLWWAELELVSSETG